MARIVTVYNRQRKEFPPTDMSHIRWLKISEALAELGHEVDIATSEWTWGTWWRKRTPIRLKRNLRKVPLSRVRWNDYDVVKTLFHRGIETLEIYGGIKHPFIISKLGSVVGPRDMQGIYFYGDFREWLYSMQVKIDKTSKYIALLSQPAKDLWESCFGPKDNVLLVPGAVDCDIPPAGRDPYPRDGKPRCVFAGNIYDRHSQPEANRVLVQKLSALGKLLAQRGIRLFMIGPGDVSKLDRKAATHLGVIPYAETWDYFRFAQVGVVVAAGEFMHNNESSKIYYYLRAGLPIVSEMGFPNDYVIAESKLGFCVENGNLELMADRIEEAVRSKWDRDFAVRYVLENHTWEKRVAVYDKLIRSTMN
jgi:glycosyltransferase involved in cell wall biosynthesis